MGPRRLTSVARTVRELTAWTLRRRSLVAVEGTSMEPALEEGDRLLVRKGSVAPGDIVIFQDAESRQRLVKRVATATPNGISVTSDNPFGARDSRQLGTIPKAAILGKATLRISPRGLRLLARRT